MIENQERDIEIFNFLNNKNVTVSDLFYSASQLPRMLGYTRNTISDAVTLLINARKFNEDNILYLGKDKYSANVKACYNIFEVFKIKRVCEYLKSINLKEESNIDRYNKQFNWVNENISEKSNISANPEDIYYN